MRWLYDCVYEEQIITGSWPVQRIAFNDLYLAYHSWCESNRKPAISKVEFGKEVAKYLYGQSQSTTQKGHAVRMIVLHPPDEVKRRLPPLDDTDLETIDLIWSNGQTTPHIR